MQDPAIADEIQQLKDQVETLQRSDARQSKVLRMQRLIQSWCILVLALAIALGYAGFSTTNRETLERIVIGMIGAAAAGHLGSNFVERKDDE